MKEHFEQERREQEARNPPFRILKQYTQGSSYVWRFQRRRWDDELRSHYYRTLKSTTDVRKAATWAVIYGLDVPELRDVEPRETPCTLVAVLLVLLVLVAAVGAMCGIGVLCR